MKTRIIFFGVVVLIAGLCAAGLYWYTHQKPDTSVIEDIEDKLALKDMSNEVNCDSVDDCGFKVKDDYELVIKYGDMRIVVSRTAFFDDEFNAALKRIGVEIKYRKDPETGNLIYRVTYYGEPMTEYSILNF